MSRRTYYSARTEPIPDLLQFMATLITVKFRRRFDAEAPRHFDVHLAADNYSPHKHAKVKAWLERHPSFHMHFTPTTSGSWLDQVERLFGLIAGNRIRCDVFNCVAAVDTR